MPNCACAVWYARCWKKAAGMCVTDKSTPIWVLPSLHWKTLSEHYRRPAIAVPPLKRDAYLSDLREHVYGLTEGLRRHVRVLWERIHHEFGYVASIDAKIRENELAQTQVSELLYQLELIRFDQLGNWLDRTVIYADC